MLLPFAGCQSSGAPAPSGHVAAVSAAPPPGSALSYGAFDAIPEWALTNSVRDTGYEIGIGSGPSLDVATRSALEDLAARLSIQVGSRLRDISREIDGKVSQNLEQIIETRVLETRFSGWQRTRSTLAAGSFWVEVRVDRGRLIEDALVELDELARQVDGILASANGSALRQLAALQTTSTERDRAQHLIVLLDGLDSDFDRSVWEARRTSWQDTIRNARLALVFAVRPDQQSQEIASWLESALAAERFAIREDGCSNLETICIEIRSEVVETDVANRYVTRIRSFIAVHEPGGGLFQERDLTGRGDSSSDRLRAHRAALDDLHDRFRKRRVLDQLLFPLPSAQPEARGPERLSADPGRIELSNQALR
jgi:hypothetical protein